MYILYGILIDSTPDGKDKLKWLEEYVAAARMKMVEKTVEFPSL